jgi:hypothetical protein
VEPTSISPPAVINTRDSPPELEARWRRLESKILAQADIFASRGVLCTFGRQRPAWRLRYCERKDDGRIVVYRTLYVGRHPVLIERTRALLHRLREPEAWERETAELVENVLPMIRKVRARLPQSLHPVRPRTQPRGRNAVP